MVSPPFWRCCFRILLWSSCFSPPPPLGGAASLNEKTAPPQTREQGRSTTQKKADKASHSQERNAVPNQRNQTKEARESSTTHSSTATKARGGGGGGTAAPPKRGEGENSTAQGPARTFLTLCGLLFSPRDGSISKARPFAIRAQKCERAVCIEQQSRAHRAPPLARVWLLPLPSFAKACINRATNSPSSSLQDFTGPITSKMSPRPSLLSPNTKRKYPPNTRKETFTSRRSSLSLSTQRSATTFNTLRLPYFRCADDELPRRALQIRPSCLACVTFASIAPSHQTERTMHGPSSTWPQRPELKHTIGRSTRCTRPPVTNWANNLHPLPRNSPFAWP